MRTRIGLVVTVCALIASTLGSGGAEAAIPGCAADGPGGDWPVFGKGTTASRFQDEEHTIGPDNVGDLQPAWVFPADSTFQSAPLSADGCVYIGTQGGHVYALNIEDGSLVWRQQLPTATTLSVANGRVFAQSGSTITAFDQVTGDVAWQRDVQPGYSSIGSPLAFENWVVAGMSGCFDLGARPAPCRGYYAILDQGTGETVVDGYDTSEQDVARGMEGAGFWSQPTYDPEDGYIYFGTANTRSVNPENPTSNALLQIDADPNRETFGEIVDFFREELNPLTNDPALAPACGANALVTIATGAVCIDDDDWPSSAVIYRDSSGRKLVGSTHSASGLPLRTFASFVVPRGNYFAIDPNGMDEVWRSPTSGARAAVAAYDGERIYHSSGYDGSILAVDPDTGEILWQASTLGQNLWQHVSAANGVVYSPSGSMAGAADSAPGMLLAFDARYGTTLLQRPMTQDIGGIALGTVSAGITIARNTVLAPVNGVGDRGNVGYVVAYRLP